MSFLKFQGEGRGGEQGRVYWSRADRDGLPFRGSQVPLLRDEEFDEFAERVDDAKFALFDTSKPDQRLPAGDPNARTYQEVLDGLIAGWFQLLFREHRWGEDADGTPVMHVYVEWSEPYMEVDPRRARNI